MPSWAVVSIVIFTWKIAALQSRPERIITPDFNEGSINHGILVDNVNYIQKEAQTHTTNSSAAWSGKREGDHAVFSTSKDDAPGLLSKRIKVSDEHVPLNDGGYSDDGMHLKLDMEKTGMQHSGHSYVVASYVFLGISGFLFFLVVVVAIGGIALEGWKHFRRVVDSFLFLWVSLAGFSAYVCCLSVSRGQGWYASLSGMIRASPKFAYDDHFVPMAIIGGISIGLIIATLLIQHLYPLPEPAEVAVSGRHNDLDHARYIFLLCIVIHHLMLVPTTNKTPFWHSWYLYILTFSLNGLILLSGYNASFEPHKLNTRRLQRIMKIALSYFWCQALIILYFYLVIRPIMKSVYKDDHRISKIQDSMTMWHGFGSSNSELDLQGFIERWFGPPGWVMWYLQALAAWLLMIPGWMRLKAPICLSFVLALATPYFKDRLFEGETSFQPTRILEYFPYFVIGAASKKYGYDKKLRSLAKDPYMQLISIMLLSGYFSWSLGSHYGYGEIEKYSYSAGSVMHKWKDAQWFYIIGRAGFFVFSTCLILAWFSLMPTKPTYFSKAASFSLVPFVFHIWVYIFLAAIGHYGIENFEKQWNAGEQVVNCLLTVGVYVTLSHPPIAMYLRWVAMPPMDWMFKNSKFLKAKLIETAEPPKTA